MPIIVRLLPVVNRFDERREAALLIIEGRSIIFILDNREE